MSQNRVETKNNIIDPVTKIVIPFLRGASPYVNSLYLSCLTQEAQMDALSVFKQETNENIIDTILKNLSDNEQLITELKKEYTNWRKKLHISHNLLHFLEFLANKDYHRIRNLLKEINEHRFENSYQNYYYGAALLGFAGAGLYFYLQPEQFEIIKNVLLEKISEYSNMLMNIAMSADILSGLIILVQFFKFLYENYIVLSNKTTSTQIKLAKLSKINAYHFLTIAAQVCIFINSGISNTISSILFVLAAGFSLALSCLQFYHHNEPSPPDDTNLKNQIHFLEAQSYYQRKKNQLHAELVALFPITIISIISIYLGPSYVLLTPICAACQFFITSMKDVYLTRQSKFYAEELQSQIRELNQEEESIEEILRSQQYSNEQKIHKLSYRFNIFDLMPTNEPMPNAAIIQNR